MKLLPQAVAFLLFSCAALCGFAGEAPTAPVPHRVIDWLDALSTNTNRLPYETNDLSARARGWSSQDSWSYRQALVFLGRSQLPDVTRMVRVRTTSPPFDPRWVPAGNTNQWLGLWLSTNSAGKATLVGAEGDTVPVEELTRVKLSPAVFSDEFQAFASIYLGRADPGKLAWNFELPVVPRQAFWTDARFLHPYVLVHQLLCALWLGMTNEASAVVQSASLRLAFTNSLAGYMRTRARLTWEAGLTNLQAGRALSDVLEYWQEHERAFGTNFNPAVAEYAGTLRSQLSEFQRLRDLTVEDPLRLPPAQRAAYFVERLSQARQSDKGLGVFKAGFPAPELVAVGRAALPILAERLEDRRLSRVKGDQHTPVVLVQDLMLDCFEQIAGGTFRTNFQQAGQFSVLPRSERDAVVTRVRAWMQAYSDKPEPVATLALNDWKPVSRLFLLDSLHERFPGVLNPVDYLRRWAAQGNADELPGLAWRLASAGDRSLLPKVCDRLRGGEYQGGECLVSFGSPKDFLAVRDGIRLHLTDTNHIGFLSAHILLDWVVELAAGRRTNQFTPVEYTVPILREALECRRFTPASSMPKTLADVAFPTLSTLTAQPTGYASNAPVALRFKAMDAWLAWWETNGSKAFAAQHPAVAALFPEPEDGSRFPERLPQLVLTTSCGSDAKEYFLLPSETSRLGREGKVRLRLLGSVAVARFLDPAAESAWTAAGHRKP